MAAIGNKWPTLMDVATRVDSSGNISDIVEILNEVGPIIDDAPFLEANDGSAHKTTVRSGLPQGTWRMLNYGVQPTKSTTVPIRDTSGMLEAYAEVDKSLVDINNNKAAFRLSEDRAFIEGMSQQFTETLFYGNTAVNPERFMGLAPRFSDSTAENGSNIIKAGGSGSDNASVWIVNWGPNTVHAFYPKGSKAGLYSEDKGQVTLEDANRGRYEGYRTHYKWDVGLTVRDWRHIVRIANIDISELTKNAATGADLVDLVVQGLEMMPNLQGGRPVIYAPRVVMSYLRRQITNKSNVHLSLGEVAGKRVTMIDDIPVRRVDALLTTEATVA